MEKYKVKFCLNDITRVGVILDKIRVAVQYEQQDGSLNHYNGFYTKDRYVIKEDKTNKIFIVSPSSLKKAIGINQNKF